MARQISVSNEVYRELSRNKGKFSFSEIIKSALEACYKKPDIEIDNAKNQLLLKHMKKGYNLGRISGNRDKWHEW